MLTVSKPMSTRSPPPCCQWEKTWKQMLCPNGAGPISAIARHLGRDRKTVRSYLSGRGYPGVRRPARPDRPGRLPRLCQSPGSPTTRTCGPRRCSTRSSGSATPART